MLVRDAQDRLSFPRDANVRGPDASYKIVEDDSIDGKHIMMRDAGIFYFSEGVNTIELHHYAEIADQFPQFMNCPDLPTGINCRDVNGQLQIAGPQSVRITIFVLTLACNDLQLTQEAIADSQHVLEGRTYPATLTGSSYDYVLRYHNAGPFPALNAVLRDTLPELVGIEAFSPVPPDSQFGRVLFWFIDSLAAGAGDSIRMRVSVPTPIDSTVVPLYSGAEIAASGDTLPDNNFASTLVFALMKPVRKNYDLSITKTASLGRAEPGMAFEYRLHVTNHGPLAATAVTVRDTLPGFIEVSDFSPQVAAREGQVLVWNVDQIGVDEALEFRYRAVVAPSLPAFQLTLDNRSGVHAENDTLPGNNLASARVLVQASEACYLDRNVYRPEIEPMLGIHFGLTEAQSVQIDVYDIAGTHLARIAERDFSIGAHRVEWNGRVEGGRRIGAGMYVVTLKGPKFKCWKKFMVIK
ncbi:MAG: DUF11 domain-containing protein [candidate division KSB1 bacterium]|nr:DUF11 domain-containing protein [candidate division KSB1 bacterium]